MQRVRNESAACDKTVEQSKMQDTPKGEGRTVQNCKVKLGKIFVRRNNKVKDKTTFDIVLDVLIGALVPLAIAGIWFLTNVKWWL